MSPRESGRWDEPIDDPFADFQPEPGSRWDPRTPAPGAQAAGRFIVSLTFVAIGVALVAMAVIAHASAHNASVEARAFAAQGRAVTISDPADVRVSVSTTKSGVNVRRIWVNLAGAWHPVADSGQGMPDDVERSDGSPVPWYVGSGLKPPIEGRRQWPPHDITFVQGRPTAYFTKDVPALLARRDVPRGHWSADALAVATAAVLSVVAWRISARRSRR